MTAENYSAETTVIQAAVSRALLHPCWTTMDAVTVEETAPPMSACPFRQSRGSAEAAGRPLARREYVSPYYFAVVYAALGESNQALEWLDKAYSDRSNGMVFLKMDPDLDSLRGNPRFLAIEKKLNFPEK